MTGTIMIEVSTGELIDRLTILEIRLERVDDPVKRANIVTEHDGVLAVYTAAIVPSDAIDLLRVTLRRINARLWDIEDDLRDCERRGDFGTGFVDLARSVYRTNDQRSAVKREINRLTGSRLVEEKSYTAY